MTFVFAPRYVALDIIPIATQGLAEIDDHINLEGSVFAGQFGFVALGFGGAIAVREADDAAHQDIRAFKKFHGALDGIRFDANRGHAVLRGQLAAVLQLLIRHRRLQERVVNHFGKFVVSVFHIGSMANREVKQRTGGGHFAPL
jgi:hypothetical protein